MLSLCGCCEDYEICTFVGVTTVQEGSLKVLGLSDSLLTCKYVALLCLYKEKF